jgi:predicted DNA-binding transcriptional regulator AlpA
MSDPSKKVVPIKQPPPDADSMVVTWTGRDMAAFIDAILDRRESLRLREDRLVEIDEAAKILSVSKEFLYRNHKRLPFTRRLGRGLLRFSVNAMQRWIKSKKV